jgi:hypothetical protein
MVQALRERINLARDSPHPLRELRTGKRDPHYPTGAVACQVAWLGCPVSPNPTRCPFLQVSEQAPSSGWIPSKLKKIGEELIRLNEAALVYKTLLKNECPHLPQSAQFLILWIKR